MVDNDKFNVVNSNYHITGEKIIYGVYDSAALSYHVLEGPAICFTKPCRTQLAVVNV